MGLTVRRKTAKNLAVRRKNERILAVSRKKNLTTTVKASRSFYESDVLCVFVFQWSGQQFVKLQSFQTYAARDVKSFSVNGSNFLAFANHRSGSGQHNINSPIYKWNGSHFVLFQSIPTRGAVALHPFMMCSQTFLGVANHHDDDTWFNTTSVVYRVSQEQFIEYQEIPTQGAFGMTSFQYKGHTYLAVANRRTDHHKWNINSVLYKWA